MDFNELFRDFWWLVFPLFGMGMAIWGTAAEERRARSTVELIKFYAGQGKEPPPELLKLVAQAEADAPSLTSPQRSNSRAWTVVTFAALTAGFGVGWWIVRAEDYAFAFLIVAVTMGVMTLGGLLILLFGRR
jgi:hypothetical protein